MANPGYVRSTDGNDADNGSTWALANATAAGAVTDAAAGDRIFFSQAHAENTGANVSATFPGTLAAPNQLLCGDDAAEPPTAITTGAQIGTNGNFSVTLNGTFYARGLSVYAQTAGASSASASINMAATTATNEVQEYDSCTIRLGSTNASPRVVVGAGGKSTQSVVVWRNTTLRFGSTSQSISIAGCDFVWLGGGIVSGSSSPSTTGLLTFAVSGRSGAALISGVDFTNAGTGLNFIAAASYNGKCIIRNCKLPASWSGGIFAAAPSAPGMRGEMHNCDNADTNYRLWVEDYTGSIKTETVIVRTGGSSDGTTPVSWKMASTANAEYPLLPLISPELPARWNSTVGSAITVTVEIITDGVTLNDDECWLELQYLGTSGFPVSSFLSDSKADVLATAAAQTTSTETWTTTGLGSPTKQKLSVTITAQEVGYIQGVVKLAKASTTAYVDPKFTVT